jgi:hypothetical protein
MHHALGQRRHTRCSLCPRDHAHWPRSRLFPIPEPPLEPVVPKELAGMHRADRAIPACEVIGGTVLVAASADTFRMRRPERNLAHEAWLFTTALMNTPAARQHLAGTSNTGEVTHRGSRIGLPVSLRLRKLVTDELLGEVAGDGHQGYGTSYADRETLELDRGAARPIADMRRGPSSRPE